MFAVGRLHELDLVRLALFLEDPPGLVAGDLPPLERAPLGDLSLDLGLERGEVVLPDRLRELEVVVEPCLDRGPDRDLRAWVQTPRCLGEEVRGRVAEHVQRVWVVAVARRQDLDARPLGQRQADVLDRAVRAHEDGLLGEPGADCPGRIEPCGPVGELELALVGKNDLHEPDSTDAPAKLTV